MARKKKEELVEPEAPAIGHNVIEVDFGDLTELLGSVADTKHTIDEATGKHRNNIKQIVSDREWHKGAFGSILKIDRMSETERAYYLRTFGVLYACMLAGKWQAETADLLAKIETEELIADAAASPPVVTTEQEKQVENA